MSKIEWTDETWNPTTGCSKVSAGCANCYMFREWPRLAGNPKTDYYGREPTNVKTHDKRLDQPLRWTKPRMIFVNSMSDLFHPKIPIRYIDRVFAVMTSTSQHNYQILTKRPERMLKYFTRINDNAKPSLEKYEQRMRAHFKKYKDEFLEGYSLPEPPTGELRFLYDSATVQEKRPTSPCGTTLRYGFSGGEYHWRPWPLHNVWLGVSVEDQKSKDRIDVLQEVPAVIRFLSLEPLLEDVGKINLTGIHWVIIGGESGPKARPMHPDWVRNIIEQCNAAGVPVFFKQWGEWVPHPHPPERGTSKAAHCLFLKPNGLLGNQGDFWDGKAQAVDKVGKKKACCRLDGIEYKEFPEGK